MKTAVGDLAIFGGQPAFATPLHVGAPNLGSRDRLYQRIDEILDRRWFTNHGPCVQDFEHRLSESMGVRHCIATCNGTVALQIAIRALGLTGEVIVPSFTFIATAHALQWQSVDPVFCDIDPATHNVDPEQVAEMITPRTTGILAVHLWGRPCDTQALAKVASRHHLRLLYDASHAFGCSHQGRMIGGFGDAEVLSFHATKFVNTFEGGAIVTDDDELADKARLMSNFGFTGYDQVVHIGSNGKMSEVCAAMGLTSLESMQEFIEVNSANYTHYRRGLSGIPGIDMVTYDERERGNYQYIVVEVDESATGIGRDALLQVLHAERVLARRYFHPGCHRMEPYCSLFPDAGLRLPHTERLAARVLSLPTGTAVSDCQIRTICQIIEFCVEHGAELSRAVSEFT